MHFMHIGRVHSAISSRRATPYFRWRKRPGVLRRNDAHQTRSWFGSETMTAQFTKDQLAFSLGDLSYVDASYDEQIPASRAPQKHSIFAWLHEWHQRRQVAAELALMSDRELADIGLSRADLSRVFDPGFAADYARCRDYIAY